MKSYINIIILKGIAFGIKSTIESSWSITRFNYFQHVSYIFVNLLSFPTRKDIMLYFIDFKCLIKIKQQFSVYSFIGRDYLWIELAFSEEKIANPLLGDCTSFHMMEGLVYIHQQLSERIHRIRIIHVSKTWPSCKAYFLLFGAFLEYLYIYIVMNYMNSIICTWKAFLKWKNTLFWFCARC
jgi:hypothetical protein